MTDQQDAPLRPGIDPFVADVISASLGHTQHVTNQLIDSLTQERDELQATLEIVREDISNLFKGPYMPTPEYVLRMLWPHKEQIAARLKDC